LERKKAYFINGGAGRVVASIPAFEKLYKTDQDFIIVCEGGMDFYKGHPQLHELKTEIVTHQNHTEFGNIIIKSVV
jgi:isocitrate/isopropylmalate dehydrogenase